MHTKTTSLHPPPSTALHSTADTALTMADFTDQTWLAAARESLLGNADLVRLIGDDKARVYT